MNKKKLKTFKIKKLLIKSLISYENQFELEFKKISQILKDAKSNGVYEVKDNFIPTPLSYTQQTIPTILLV